MNHHSQTPFLLRPFARADEPAVRTLSLDTALYGRDIRPVLDDVALISEALVGYFVRYEPGHLWVATRENRVIGYLTGCMDTRAGLRRFALRILPRLVVRLILHGSLFRSPARGVLIRSLRHGQACQAAKRAHLASHPAHLHINLAADSRGHGIGTALLRRFLEQATAAGVPGVHLCTANDPARRFFEHEGFRRLEQFRSPALDNARPHTTWLMGLGLNGRRP